MKKRQDLRLVPTSPGTFLALNRKTARHCSKLGYSFTRKEQTPVEVPNKQELNQYRKDLAKAYGSTTGKLKKKHITRDRKLNEVLEVLKQGAN